MDDVKTTGHVWTEVFSPTTYSAHPAMPLIVMFWILLIAIVFRDFIYSSLARLFPSIVKVGELEIDEDLENYFHTIDDHDRNWSIKEERNARKVLKMKILDDYTLNKFKSTKKGATHMKGVHCYDILANPLYLDDFQYFSPSMDNRAEYIIDDDEDEDNDTA